jgi:hypothetical protein
VLGLTILGGLGGLLVSSSILLIASRSWLTDKNTRASVGRNPSFIFTMSVLSISSVVFPVIVLVNMFCFYFDWLC